MPICNICNTESRQFMSYGTPTRRDVRCPLCFSLERHRFIWLYMQEQLKGERMINLLHFAPENCLYQVLKSRRDINYFLCDYAPANYNYPPGTITADITALPFSDNFFDFIICVHVLEHIEEEKLALMELKRVLRPDGLGLICVPIEIKQSKTYENKEIRDPKQRQRHFGQHDHVRLYGLDFTHRLQEFFQVEEHQCKTIDQDIIKIHRLSPSHYFHVIRKL